jgi:hypothetical protein
MKKRDKKFDPRAQPRGKKWSFFIKCGCRIGFFVKKPILTLEIQHPKY